MGFCFGGFWYFKASTSDQAVELVIEACDLDHDLSPTPIPNHVSAMISWIVGRTSICTNILVFVDGSIINIDIYINLNGVEKGIFWVRLRVSFLTFITRPWYFLMGFKLVYHYSGIQYCPFKIFLYNSLSF